MFYIFFLRDLNDKRRRRIPYDILKKASIDAFSEIGFPRNQTFEKLLNEKSKTQIMEGILNESTTETFTRKEFPRNNTFEKMAEVKKAHNMEGIPFLFQQVFTNRPFVNDSEATNVKNFKAENIRNEEEIVEEKQYEKDRKTIKGKDNDTDNGAFLKEPFPRNELIQKKKNGVLMANFTIIVNKYQ